MSKLYWFSAALFLVLNVNAQSGAAAKKDTTKKSAGISFEELKKNLSQGNPLFIINGFELKDSLSNDGFKGLEPEDISSINVLKPIDAIKLFNSKGKNGAVLITTKPRLFDADKPLDPVKPDSSVYMIDGVPSKTKLDGIDPKDILSITIISKDKARQFLNGSADRGMVVVVTKAGAIKSYQGKFGTISSVYKEYLISHNSDDSGLLYSIDGYNCDSGIDGITRLYNPPKEKIAEIKISSKENMTKADITTKK